MVVVGGYRYRDRSPDEMRRRFPPLFLRRPVGLLLRAFEMPLSDAVVHISAGAADEEEGGEGAHRFKSALEMGLRQKS